MNRMFFLCLTVCFLISCLPAAAQDAWNVRQVAQLFHDWNSAEAVAVDVDHAFVIDLNAGMHVVDISRPSSPRQVSTFTYESPAYDVAAGRGYAYIAAGSDGLIVVDATDPSEPEQVAVVHDIGDVRGITLTETRAYVAAGTDGLVILNVANPRSPEVLGRIDTPGFAVNTHLQGDYACVADRRGGLRIINVQNPAEPTEVGSIEPMGETRAVTSSGQLLYTADTQGLSEIVISVPSNPQRIDFVELPSPGLAIDYSNNCIHVATGDHGVFTYDVNTGFADQEPTETCEFAADVLIIGDHCFVAGREEGLRILSLANHLQPAEIGHYGNIEYLRSVALRGNQAFLGNYTSGVMSISITNPLIPQMVWREEGDGRRTSDIAIQENYLYVIDNWGNILRIADIFDPEDPQWLGSLSLRNDLKKITVSLPFLYITINYGGTKIVDVTNPSSPILVGTIDSEFGYHYEVAIAGDNAFIATSRGLRVVNVADPLNPRDLTVYQPDLTFMGIKIRGNYAFLSHYGFEAVDISNPREIHTIGSCELPGWPREIVLDRDWAFVALGDDGIYVLNISNPVDMQVVGYFDTPGSAYDIAVSGNLAYVADDQNFGIYDFSQALDAPLVEDIQPMSFKLYPAYPNPFNSGAVIPFELPNPAQVSLRIYDTEGRVVFDLANGMFPTGCHSVNFNGSGLPGGTYVYSLEAGKAFGSGRLVFVK